MVRYRTFQLPGQHRRAEVDLDVEQPELLHRGADAEGVHPRGPDRRAVGLVAAAAERAQRLRTPVNNFE